MEDNREYKWDEIIEKHNGKWVLLKNVKEEENKIVSGEVLFSAETEDEVKENLNVRLLVSDLREELKNGFVKDDRILDFPINLYHVTDRYVWETRPEDRKMYQEAFIKYLNTAKNYISENGVNKDNLIIDKSYNLLKYPLEDKEVKAVLLLFRRWLEGPDNCEYGIFYTSTSLIGADTCAKAAHYFGERGIIVHGLCAVFKKYEVDINIDVKTMEVLDKLFMELESRKEEPVVLATRRMDLIESLDNGDLNIIKIENGVPGIVDISDKEALIKFLLEIRKDSLLKNNTRIENFKFKMSNEISMDDFKLFTFEEIQVMEDREAKRARDILNQFKDKHIRICKAE